MPRLRVVVLPDGRPVQNGKRHGRKHSNGHQPSGGEGGHPTTAHPPPVRRGRWTAASLLQEGKNRLGQAPPSNPPDPSDSAQPQRISPFCSRPPSPCNSKLRTAKAAISAQFLSSPIWPLRFCRLTTTGTGLDGTGRDERQADHGPSDTSPAPAPASADASAAGSATAPAAPAPAAEVKRRSRRGGRRR